MDADQTTARDKVESAIRQLLPMLNHDELRVIEFDLRRLLKGRETYGPLDLTAPRDWARDEFEELADARMYRLMAQLQRRDAERERLHCEAADELATKPIAKVDRSSDVLAALREFRDSAAYAREIRFDESETVIIDEPITGNGSPLKAPAALANRDGDSRSDASRTALAVPTSSDGEP